MKPWKLNISHIPTNCATATNGFHGRTGVALETIRRLNRKLEGHVDFNKNRIWLRQRLCDCLNNRSGWTLDWQRQLKRQLRLVDDVRPNCAIGLCLSANLKNENERRDAVFCPPVTILVVRDWVVANKSPRSEPRLLPYRIFLYKLYSNSSRVENFIYLLKLVHSRLL